MNLESLPVRIVVGTLMAVVLAVAVLLLISPNDREGLMRRFVDEEAAVHGGTITVRSLLPAMPHTPAAPPLGTPARQADRASGSGPAAQAAPRSEPAEEAPPRRSPERASRESRPRESGQAESQPNLPTPVQSAPEASARESSPPRTPSQPAAVSQANGQSAYDLVVASRPAMGQAAAAGRTTWRVVKDEEGVIWLDIVVSKEGDQHYIWEVNLQKRTAQPLSSAARNLGG